MRRPSNRHNRTIFIAVLLAFATTLSYEAANAQSQGCTQQFSYICCNGISGTANNSCALKDALAKRMHDSSEGSIVFGLASGYGLGTPSTIKKASISSLATSSELPYPWRSSQYKMTSSPTPLRTELLTSLMLLSFWQPFRVMSRRPMKASQGTTVATPVGAEVNARSSPLLQSKKRRVTIEESSVRAVGPRASRESTR